MESGARIGAYEIVSALGAGGMGDRYIAPARASLGGERFDMLYARGRALPVNQAIGIAVPEGSLPRTCRTAKIPGPERRRTAAAMHVRDADPAETDALARVWHDAWRDAHDGIVPPGLVRIRTLQNFRDRMQAALDDVRVAGPPGAPVGFCMLKDDELHQLFVTAAARGSGVAGALIDDAEARLAGRGVATAWLACAIGNDRAARFYEKRGWHRAGTMVSQLDTPDGPFALEVWRYEKSLTRR
jgi:GNAT superfamily N-acetyltransferase